MHQRAQASAAAEVDVLQYFGKAWQDSNTTAAPPPWDITFLASRVDTIERDAEHNEMKCNLRLVAMEETLSGLVERVSALEEGEHEHESSATQPSQSVVAARKEYTDLANRHAKLGVDREGHERRQSYEKAMACRDEQDQLVTSKLPEAKAKVGTNPIPTRRVT